MFHKEEAQDKLIQRNKIHATDFNLDDDDLSYKIYVTNPKGRKDLDDDFD